MDYPEQKPILPIWEGMWRGAFIKVGLRKFADNKRGQIYMYDKYMKRIHDVEDYWIDEIGVTLGYSR